MSGTHDPKERFETLCHVVADISAAPFTWTRGKSGKICYSREYDVVLLVGLTELKAQIRWFDSTTVRIRGQLCYAAFSDLLTPRRECREKRKGATLCPLCKGVSTDLGLLGSQ